MIRRRMLTKVELALLEELARSGDTVLVVSLRLDMGYQTAKNHLTNVYRVLRVHSRGQKIFCFTAAMEFGPIGRPSFAARHSVGRAPPQIPPSGSAGLGAPAGRSP